MSQVSLALGVQIKAVVINQGTGPRLIRVVVPGMQGPPGNDGPPGPGLPPGGSTGQIPQKASADDYDIVWVDNEGGTDLGPDPSFNTVTTTSETEGFALGNGTEVAVGSFDNGTGGNNGISLICFLGYELNWQGGRLRIIQRGDSGGTSLPLVIDSPVVLSPEGVEFDDGTIQTTAAATVKPAIRLLDPVKWFWYIKYNNDDSAYRPTGSPDYAGQGSDRYNGTTKILTAASYVALPSPYELTGGTQSLPLPLVPMGFSDAVDAGYQVGDRILWMDDWDEGGHGVYTILDIGEDGVRPYRLQLVPELHDNEVRAGKWITYLEYGPGEVSSIYAQHNGGTFYQSGDAFYGSSSVTLAENAYAEGDQALAAGRSSRATGGQALAAGFSSSATGYQASATSDNSIVSGGINTKASGYAAFSGGMDSDARGISSVTLGRNCVAKQLASAAVGINAVGNAFGVAFFDGWKGAAIFTSCIIVAGSREANQNDVGAMLICDASGPITFTLPATASDNPDVLDPIPPAIFNRGTFIYLVQNNANPVTIDAGAGVTVRGPTLSTVNEGDLLWLHFDGDTWRVFYIPNSATAPGAVPNGGATGQALKKLSNADQDFDWVDDETGSSVAGDPVDTSTTLALTSNATTIDASVGYRKKYRLTTTTTAGITITISNLPTGSGEWEAELLLLATAVPASITWAGATVIYMPGLDFTAYPMATGKLTRIGLSKQATGRVTAMVWPAEAAA